MSDLEDLRLRTERQAESARRAVHDVIWPIGRGFAPHQAEEAEQEMLRQLGSPICFDDAGTSIKFLARVRVRPDPRVLTVLEPFWRRYVEMESEHVLGELRADLVAVRAKHWRGVFNDLTATDLGDIVLPYVARLTDSAFADVMVGLENDRQRARIDLVNVLDSAAKNHARMGLFEFAEAYDKAVEAFKRNQGLVDAEGSN